MSNPVSMQLWQALAALATGSALGLVYDALKAVRLHVKKRALVHFLDMVFWAAAAAVLFVFGQWSGNGKLRLFMVAGSAVGFAVYMETLSGIVLGVLDAVVGLICRFLSICAAPAFVVASWLKKFAGILKNVFKKLRTWFTIKKDSKDGGTGEVSDEKDGAFETETGKYFYKTYRDSADCLRADAADTADGANVGSRK